MKESDEGYFLQVEVQYPVKLHELHNDLPFLPEWMKIEKFEKLIVNLHDKNEYFIHIKNLKQTLNQGLAFGKFHRVIKFNEEAWIKSYIDINAKLRKKAKNDFEEDFFKLMNNAVFGKTMKNMRKYRGIKLVTTERRKNYYDYVKPKCGEDAKLCLCGYRQLHIYKDIPEDVETRFNSLNFELDRPLSKGKYKK